MYLAVCKKDASSKMFESVLRGAHVTEFVQMSSHTPQLSCVCVNKKNSDSVERIGN